MKTFVYLCLLILGIVSACRISFEKRRYNKGYHVELSRKYKAGDDRPTKTPEKEASSSTALSDAAPKNSGVQTKSEQTAPTEETKQAITAQTSISTAEQTKHTGSEKSVAINQNKSGTAPKNVLSISQKRNRSNSGTYWFYLIPGLTIATAFVGLMSDKKRTWNIAKLASKNPKKSRFFITLGHFTIGALGYGIGRDLHSLGFVSPSFTPDIFSTILAVAAGLLFLEERRTKIQVWQSYFKQKFLHLMIVGTFLGSMIAVGNSVQQKATQSTPIGMLAAKMYQQDHTEQSISVDVENEEGEEGEGQVGRIVLFSLLLLIVAAATVAVTCALSCDGSVVGAISVSILGLVLMGLLIRSIVRESKKIKAAKGQTP